MGAPLGQPPKDSISLWCPTHITNINAETDHLDIGETSDWYHNINSHLPCKIWTQAKKQYIIAQKALLSDAAALFVKEDMLHVTERKAPMRPLSHKGSSPILLLWSTPIKVTDLVYIHPFNYLLSVLLYSTVNINIPRQIWAFCCDAQCPFMFRNIHTQQDHTRITNAAQATKIQT